MTGREYAEKLVGPLERQQYEGQRNVARQTYSTNWEALQNQYKNLQEQLKQRQELANRDFANGLSNVAEGSFDRMHSANQNLANRGLTTAGVRDTLNQQDIAEKGREVTDLLGGSNKALTSGMERLSKANQEMANNEASLNDRLADTLGRIGAGETNAQMAYNTGLTNLGEEKEARDFANQMAAKQRAAARASSGGRGKSKAQKDLDDFRTRLAINDVLTDKDLTDQEKQNILAIGFHKYNDKDILNAYNKAINTTDNYNKKLKELKRDVGIAKGRTIRDYRDTLPEYVNKTKYSEPISTNALENYANYDNYLKNTSDLPIDIVNDFNNKQAKVDKFKNTDLTYDDLRKLLYG